MYCCILLATEHDRICLLPLLSLLYVSIYHCLMCLHDVRLVCSSTALSNMFTSRARHAGVARPDLGPPLDLVLCGSRTTIRPPGRPTPILCLCEISPTAAAVIRRCASPPTTRLPCQQLEPLPADRIHVRDDDALELFE